MAKAYVNNTDLMAAILMSKEKGQLTPETIKMFTLMIHGISKKMAYKDPEDREDCMAFAMEDLVKYWNRFDPSDLIYNFGDFKVPENTKQTSLTVFDYKLDKFKNLNNPNRKGFCYLKQEGKATPKGGEEFLKIFTSDDISNWYSKGGDDYLLETLNQYEYLITFEDKTYLTTIAGLCGTKSIIVNNENYSSPIDFRLKNPIQLFGVAYGLDDIGWANKTIDLVRDNIIELEKRDSITVDNFVNYWENKLL